MPARKCRNGKERADSPSAGRTAEFECRKPFRGQEAMAAHATATFARRGWDSGRWRRARPPTTAATGHRIAAAQQVPIRSSSRLGISTTSAEAAPVPTATAAGRMPEERPRVSALPGAPQGAFGHGPRPARARSAGVGQPPSRRRPPARQLLRRDAAAGRDRPGSPRKSQARHRR
jgi:hypothetical protein